MNITQFGDIFLNNSQEYIFLAQRDEIIYAAKIIGKKEGNQIKNLCELRLRNPKTSQIVNQSSLFCFVELTTDEYKGKFAHLNNVGNDESSFPFKPIGSRLNEYDLINLKKEIIEGAVPKVLKSMIEKIDI